MPITELLEKNAQMYGDEVSLVEINPKAMEHAKVTWREYSLIETNPMVLKKATRLLYFL